MVCFINFLDNFLPLFRPELCTVKTMLPYLIVINFGQQDRIQELKKWAHWNQIKKAVLQERLPTARKFFKRLTLTSSRGKCKN